MSATILLHEPSLIPLPCLGQKARLFPPLWGTIVFPRVARPTQRFQIIHCVVLQSLLSIPTPSTRAVDVMDAQVFIGSASMTTVAITVKGFLAVAAVCIAILNTVHHVISVGFRSLEKRAVGLFHVQLQAAWSAMVRWSLFVNHRITAARAWIGVAYAPPVGWTAGLAANFGLPCLACPTTGRATQLASAGFLKRLVAFDTDKRSPTVSSHHRNLTVTVTYV